MFLWTLGLPAFLAFVIGILIFSNLFSVGPYEFVVFASAIAILVGIIVVCLLAFLRRIIWH